MGSGTFGGSQPRTDGSSRLRTSPEEASLEAASGEADPPEEHLPETSRADPDLHGTGRNAAHQRSRSRVSERGGARAAADRAAGTVRYVEPRPTLPAHGPRAPNLKDTTRRALNAVNRAFYAARGADFDASRDHPWPGWKRVLTEVARRLPADDEAAAPLRVLDLGCGNGRFGAALGHAITRPTQYLGVDASEPLLESARETLRAPPPAFEVELRLLDFLGSTGADLQDEAIPHGPFDLIAVFGVLHHVPSEALRRRLVEALADRLAPLGLLALTAWQFEGRTRFARSVLPDETVAARAGEWGFDADDLEPGDHLLGFGGDAVVPRYCHHIDEDELSRLTEALGLKVVDAFTDDGKSADLNLYRLLAKPAG